MLLAHRARPCLLSSQSACHKHTIVCPSTPATVQQTSAFPQQLDKSTAPALLEQLDTLILDCDGVFWRGNDVVPHAVEALHLMRTAGKRLLFVTNNSSKSRKEYVSKFKSLGFEVEAAEIISSSYTAAAYLSSIGFGKTLHPGRHALLFGSQGMHDELSAAGVQVLDGRDLKLPLLDTVEAMLRVQLDDRIGAVIVGWDPTFNYSKLVYASACLRELPGCLFVATNLDHADYIGNGRMMPGTGTLVSAVQVAANQQPVNVGKGGAWLFPYLLRRFQLEPTRTAVIGDRLDTDIRMGKEGGLVTILPLTGVSTIEDALKAGFEGPDYIVDSVAALVGL